MRCPYCGKELNKYKTIYSNIKNCSGCRVRWDLNDQSVWYNLRESDRYIVPLDTLLVIGEVRL